MRIHTSVLEWILILRMMNFGDAQAAFVGICVAWFSQPSKNPTNSVLLGNNHMFIFL